MLHIAIHVDRRIAVAIIKAGDQRHLMAEPARQMKNRYTRIKSRNVFKNRQGIVARSVEYIDHAKDISRCEPIQYIREGLVKDSDSFFLVIDGQNNIDGHESVVSGRWSVSVLHFA